MNSGKEISKGQVVTSKVFFAMICALVLVLIGNATCFATTVTLQWGADSDSTVTGYKVYYQANSGTTPFTGTGATQGASPIDVKNVTTTTVSGLNSANSYYFAITAYNASGVESAYSNIVSVSEMAPPTVSLTAPANNATVSGTVSVTATATDNVGVTKVEFYVNNVLQSTDTSTPYLYSWNTASLAAGSYTLMAKAYDAAGNVGQSSNVSVTVLSDTTAPTVSVTAPAGNATVSGTVTISASASDNVGVTKVEFYENGVLLSAGNVAPYSYSWNTKSVANGSYTLTAKAYDAAGNVGQSSNVSVTVNNPVADTTAPTVSVTAPANATTVSGTATITATAADNVGVTKVEFYLDGALQSTDTTSPYSWSWNTTTTANGSHSLVSKAYDAAGNIGTSATVTVTVSNSTSQQLLGNPGFENGSSNTAPWTTTSGVVDSSTSEPAHSGTWKAWLDGYGSAHTDSIVQTVAIPSTITTATLAFWLHIDTAETTTTTAYDTLKVQIRNSSGTVLATLATYSNLNKNTGYAQKSFDVSAYKGQTIQVYLVGTEDSSAQTSFVVDDFTLNVQ